MIHKKRVMVMNSVKNINYKQKITVIGLIGLALLTIVILKVWNVIKSQECFYRQTWLDGEKDYEKKITANLSCYS